MEGQQSGKSGQTGSCVVVGGVSKTKLKKLNKCIDNIVTTIGHIDMNPTATPYVNQAQPLGIQTPQTYNGTPLYPTTPMAKYILPSPPNTQSPQTIPAWAVELLEDMKQLK